MAWPTTLVTPAFAAVLMTLLAVQLTNAADRACGYPPPGMRKMFRGVDITDLDLIPLSSSEVATQKFKGQPIKFSCNNYNAWLSPAGIRYDEPDQAWSNIPIPGGKMSATSKIIKTESDVQKSMSAHISASGGFLGFSFSVSASKKEMTRKIKKEKKQLSEVSAYQSCAKIQLVPAFALELDPKAQAYVDKNLKNKPFTKKNKKLYTKFIKMFGTHFFKEANFGGTIKKITELTEAYTKTHKEESTRVKAKASFWGMTLLNKDKSQSSSNTNEQFSSDFKYTLKYYGGSANVLAADGLGTWAPTVILDPWLFSGKLEAIHEVVKDTTVKAELEKATKEHVLRVYLKEFLKEIMEKRIQKRSALLDEYKTKVVNMLVKDVIDIKEAEGLRTPDWFTQNTNFCFQWKATGDKAQCGDGKEKSWCAAPNTMTPDYRDNTDDRKGGCMLQWSLSSMEHPDWFKKVKLCFKHNPTVDWHECGANGVAKTVCAPLNQFTPEYLDDTSKRSGGCQMAWKLDLSGVYEVEPPFWLRKTKVCLKFWADGDRAQCNNNGRHELCAEANNWTEYYLDDTNARGGGCKMSWGLKYGLY